MPTVVTCPNCTKRLSVRDELIGKKLKCPGCGATFEAKATSNLMPRAGSVKSKEVKVAISPGLMIGIGAIVVVIVAIVVLIFGPVAAWKEWEKLGADPNDNVSEVVTRGIQSYLSEQGSWNPRKPGNTPHANDDITFIRNMFVMSMPTSVPFQGSTTEGGFKGTYHPKTGEVEADVGIGGTSVAGLGAIREGNKKIHVTGRMKNGVVSAEVDGRVAELHYPPEDKE